MGGPSSSSSPRTKRQFPPEHLLDPRKTSTSEEEYEEDNPTVRNKSTPGYILVFFLLFPTMSTSEGTESDCDRAPTLAKKDFLDTLHARYFGLSLAPAKVT